MQGTEPSSLSEPPFGEASLFSTTRLVLMAPSSFFGNLPVEDRYSRALIYLVPFLLVGMTATGAYHLISGKITDVAGEVVTLLSLPLAVLAGVALSTLLNQVGIKLCITKQKGQLLNAWRIAAYATGATFLATLLPYVGWIASIYQLILTVIGIKAAYRVDWFKAVATIIIPALLFALVGAAMVFPVIILMLIVTSM